MNSARKLLLLGRPALQLVMSDTFVSHRGYPGEGPVRKAVVRNSAGTNARSSSAPPGIRPQHPSVQRVASETRTPSPLTRPSRVRMPNIRLADEPGSRSSHASTPAPSMPPPPSTAESVALPDANDLAPEHLISHGSRVSFISRFKMAVRQLRYYRKEYRKQSPTDAAEVRGSRGFKPGVHEATVANRVRVSSVQLKELISAHPEGVEQAEVVARVIEDLPMPSRLALRNTSPMKIEQYVFVRDAFETMKKDWWTPYNWLELRLKKYISHSTFAFAHRIFSQAEDSEGKWNRVALLPMPTPQWRARAHGIFSPFWVPSFVRTPQEMARSQNVILKDHTISTSDDGKGAYFDPVQATSDCINHTIKQGNLRPLSSTDFPHVRLQSLCDALGFYRGGRMATRFGIRCMDNVYLTNSPYFFHNVSIYLNNDKHKELEKYLDPVLAKYNAHSTSKPMWDKEMKPILDEKDQPEFETEICMPVDTTEGPITCQLADGGDAAGANAMAALESPPSKMGCCHYCELPGTDWYNRSKCDSAQRRNLRRAYLMAHRLPPGTPTGATLFCPKCGYGLSAAQEARDLKEFADLTPAKANGVDLEHRKHHAGQQYLQRKLLHVDHKWRALSLLHLMLNTVSSTLKICIAAGATKSDRARCNKLLEEEQHQWRLKETKSTFEKKPAGNECRHFLWKKGDVLLKLLRARYGTSAGSCASLEVEVQAAQAEGAHHCNNGAPTRARDPPPAAAQTKRPKNRAQVSVGGAIELAGHGGQG